MMDQSGFHIKPPSGLLMRVPSSDTHPCPPPSPVVVCCAPGTQSSPYSPGTTFFLALVVPCSTALMTDTPLGAHQCCTMLACGVTGATRNVLHWMLEAGGRNLLNARSRWGHHALHFAAANCNGGPSLLQELINYLDLLKDLDISGAQTLSSQARQNVFGMPA